MFNPLNHPEQIMRLFATPIYTDLVDRNKFQTIQDEFQKTYETLKQQDRLKHNPAWGSNTHLLSAGEGWDFSKNLLKEFELNTFVDELYRHCRLYLKYTGSVPDVFNNAEFDMMGSWMTVTQKGQYAHTHDHGNSDISGAYWFKTTGKDGDFNFESPNKLVKCSDAFVDYEKSWQLQPQVGRLILFPGFIDHSVKENKTDNDRISISFNIKIKTPT